MTGFAPARATRAVVLACAAATPAATVSAQGDGAEASREPTMIVHVTTEATAIVRSELRVDGTGISPDETAHASFGLGAVVERRFGLVRVGGGFAAQLVDFDGALLQPDGLLDLYDLPARLGVVGSIPTRFGALDLGVVGLGGPSISTRRWTDAPNSWSPQPSPGGAHVGAVVGGFGMLALRFEPFLLSLEAGYQQHCVAGYSIPEPGFTDPISVVRTFDGVVALGGPCLRLGFGFAR